MWRMAEGLIGRLIVAATAAAGLCVVASCTPPATSGGTTTTTTPVTTTSTATTSTTTTTVPPGGTGAIGGPWLIVAETDLGAVRIFDTRSLAPVETIQLGGQIGGELAVVGDQLYYSIPGQSSGAVGRYDFVTGSNDRAAIPHVDDGGILRSTPMLPNRLFVAERGIPAKLRSFDVSGSKPIQLAQTERDSIGSNIEDFTFSADGTRIWLGPGVSGAITEVRTVDLVATGRLYRGDAFFDAVAATTVPGGEIVTGAASASIDHLFSFDATNPAAVSSRTVEAGLYVHVVDEGLAYSPDGNTLYVATANGSFEGRQPQLLAIDRESGATLRMSPLLDTSVWGFTFGQLVVDRGTARVFVSGGNEIDVFNADGTKAGSIPTQPGPRGMVTTATALVAEPPRPAISVSTPGAVAGTSVGFTATTPTSKTVSSTEWDFGDGGSPTNSATGTSASHTYRLPGTYVVTATMTDEDGARGSTSSEVVIAPALNAAITFDPAEAPAGRTISFMGDGSTAQTGSIVSYDWNFGEPSSPSNTASGPTATHSYRLPGTYVVRLTITGSSGEVAMATASIFAGPTLVPSITSTPSAPFAAQRVEFSGAASIALTGSITGYGWDFGDGSPGATGPLARHAFSAPGTYTVRLTLTGSNGETASATTTLTAQSGLTPRATTSPEQPVEGFPVTFSAVGSTDEVGAITSYTWDFRDGTTATGAVVSHTFTSSDAYPVRLTVTDDLGQRATIVVPVAIASSIVTDLAITPSPAHVGEAVTLDASRSHSLLGRPLTYLWSLGQLPTVEEGWGGEGPPVITRTFTSPGVEYVYLVVQDDQGRQQTVVTSFDVT
jgi:PKD repeat protein